MAPKQDRTCKLGLHCSVAPGCAFTHLTTQTSHTKYIYEVLIHIDVKNICLYLKGSGHTLFLSLSFSPLAHPNVAWMTHSKVPITGLLPSLDTCCLPGPRDGYSVCPVQVWHQWKCKNKCTFLLSLCSNLSLLPKTIAWTQQYLETQNLRSQRQGYLPPLPQLRYTN